VYPAVKIQASPTWRQASTVTTLLYECCLTSTPPVELKRVTTRSSSARSYDHECHNVKRHTRKLERHSTVNTHRWGGDSLASAVRHAASAVPVEMHRVLVVNPSTPANAIQERCGGPSTCCSNHQCNAPHTNYQPTTLPSSSEAKSIVYRRPFFLLTTMQSLSAGRFRLSVT